MIKNFIYIITVLLAFSRSSFLQDFVPISLYYGWFALLGLIFILDSYKEKRYNFSMVLFFTVGVISILWNDIDSYFLPWQRFISFLILIIAIGPFLENTGSIKFKINLFKISNVLIMAITIISFTGFVLKNQMFFNASGFSGLSNQSMLLGPIAGFSAIISLNYYFNTKKRKMKLIYIIFIIISILTCLLAASRGAVVSLLIAVIFLIYLSFRKSLGKFLKVVLIFLSLILLTSSLWLPYTEQLIFKNQSRMQTDNLFSGRSRMWKDRIEDFKYSPIYGVGFSSLKNTSNSKISSLGFIEPGSGWLFILSSLGILGFIIFTKLIFKPIFSLSKKNDLKNKSYALIVSILIFFVFHLGIEGYVLSSGGFLFFYLWLTIAIAQKRSVFYLESSY